MKKGFIFDLDGVICFTDEYHYLAWKALADSEGIYFDKEINNRLKGVSRMDSLDIILERANKTYTDEEKVAMATKKNDIYKEYLEEMSEKDVSEEVVNTLKKLKEMGIKISLGSSSKNAKLILSKIGLLDLFDQIADGTDIKNSKPDPEVFLCAANKLGLEPADCCVVEDAKAGIDAAKAGGFTAIGIGDAADYEKTDHPINTFKDILNYTE
jgi:beta-phosphoglucomutase